MTIWKDAWDNNVEGVKAFVTANPTKKDDLSPDRQCSILYTAARGGHFEMVKFLLNAGCNVNRQNGENESTPLHGAAFGGHHKVVELLIAYNAKMLTNAYGDTPLDDCGNSEAKASDIKKCKALLEKLAAAPAPASSGKKLHRGDSQEAAPAAAPAAPAAAAAAAAAAPIVALVAAVAAAPVASASKPDYNGMTVPELKAACISAGLSTSGKKADLVSRLTNADSGDSCEGADGKPPTKKPKKSGDVVYNMAEIDELKTAGFTLVEIPKDTEAFWAFEEKFPSYLQGRNNDYVRDRVKSGKRPLTFILNGVWEVKNPILEQRFERKKKFLLADNPAHARERISFHGTNPKNLDSILRTSLLRFKHPLNPCKTQADDGYFGTNKKGVYVSRYADYTFKYSNSLDPLDVGMKAKVIMFRTLPGNSKHIPELVGAIDPTDGFHSHSSPQFLEWYVFEEDQLCPQYVLEVKCIEDNRTLADDGDDK